MAYNRVFDRVNNGVFQANALGHTLPPLSRMPRTQLAAQARDRPVPFHNRHQQRASQTQPYSQSQSRRRTNQPAYVTRTTIITSSSGKPIPKSQTVTTPSYSFSNHSSATQHATHTLSNISAATQPTKSTVTSTSRQHLIASIATSLPQSFNTATQQPNSSNSMRATFTQSKRKNKSKKVSTSDMMRHYCETCKICCTGEQTWRMHLEGQRHKKKVCLSSDAEVPEGMLKCELCNVVVTGEDGMKLHVNGVKHSKALKLHLKLGKPIPELPVGLVVPYTTSSSVASSVSTETTPCESLQQTPMPVVQKSTSFAQQPVSLLQTSTPNSFALETSSGCLDETNVQNESTVTGTEVTCEEKSDALGRPADMDQEAVGEEYVETLPPSKDLPKGGFKCVLCSCVFNDDVARRLHVRGRKHKMTYKKKFMPDLVVDVQPSKARRRAMYQEKVAADKQKRQIMLDKRPRLAENAKKGLLGLQQSHQSPFYANLQQKRSSGGRQLMRPYSCNPAYVPAKLNQHFEPHRSNYYLQESHSIEANSVGLPFQELGFGQQMSSELQQHDKWGKQHIQWSTRDHSMETNYQGRGHHSEGKDYSHYPLDTQEESYNDKHYDNYWYSNEDIHYEEDTQYGEDLYNEETCSGQLYDDYRHYNEGRHYRDETAYDDEDHNTETYYTDDTSFYGRQWTGSHDNYNRLRNPFLSEL